MLIQNNFRYQERKVNMENNNFSIPDKLIVHGGEFHADDVMTAAILKSLNPDIEIERVYSVPDELSANTLVADIGFGKYDHHQDDKALPDCSHFETNNAINLIM